MTAPERIWADFTLLHDQVTTFYCQDGPYSGGTEYVRADLAAVPAQVKVKPLDLSNALKHAFICGRVSAGAASSFHADAWAEYDPTESAGYARILASIEPQPDPRDEVIARLVEALRNLLGIAEDEGIVGDKTTLELARAALAAAKAVQK